MPVVVCREQLPLLTATAIAAILVQTVGPVIALHCKQDMCCRTAPLPAPR